VITLNFLPPEARKKAPKGSLGDRFPKVSTATTQFFSKVPFQLMYLYVGGALLALYTLFFLLAMVQTQTLRGLRQEWEVVSPERDKISKLSLEYAELEAAEMAVRQLNRQFRWSRKLSALSDAMVWGIWLREIALGERHVDAEGSSVLQKTLILSGTAASPRDDKTALVGRFIRSLKENEAFFSDFKDVELESIKRRSINSLDVMDFKVICSFREGVIE